LDEKSGVQAVKHAAAVSAAFAELGIRKPTANLNTFKVAEKYNSLRDCLTVLCELQRLQAEATYDVAVMKAHKTALRSALKKSHGTAAGDDVPSAEVEGALLSSSTTAAAAASALVDPMVMMMELLEDVNDSELLENEEEGDADAGEEEGEVDVDEEGEDEEEDEEEEEEDDPDAEDY
jgi:hypothetical protein